MMPDIKFILVDDDPISNIISSLIIRKTLGETHITVFNQPEKGLAYIKNEFINEIGLTILLLDINMPTLTGYEFMEQFEQFDDDVKNKVVVYLLSSSVNQTDKDKAAANKYIKGFISKPLTSEAIISVTTAAVKGNIAIIT